MAIITSTTTVTIGDAAATVTTVDFTLGASSNGTGALRKLVYPDATVLAQIVYENNPDEWTNFDITPMVKRPKVGVLRTYAYFETPPLTSFIQWQPRDRTTTAYNIVIESLTVGGQDIRMNYIAANAGYVLGDVVLRFRIISEV
jgi:hypothetical protein